MDVPALMDFERNDILIDIHENNIRIRLWNTDFY